MTKDEALKMAIDYLEYQYEIGAWGQDLEGLIDCCKEALEQPTQEPVAVITPDNYGEPRLDFICTFKYKAITAVNPDIPLYTHPAPSWQGLSDAELDALNGSPMTLEYSGLYKFARAIEQELKEKNNG